MSGLGPGAAVSNLRAVLGRVEPGASGLGAVGFVALVNGTRSREPVLVSNRHVLLAHDAARGDPVYSPVLDGGVIRGDELDPVGEILDEGLEGNHRFAYPDEAEDDYFVDCATARVSGNRAGTPVVRGVARVHPLDVLGTRAPHVRKLGGATGATVGRVVDAAASVESAGGATRLRNLLVRGIGGPFVGPGDSGALVVNSRDEAVGLLWGCDDRDPELAYACHIHPVLHRLDVTMLTRSFP